MAGNTDTITNVMDGKSVVDSISGNFISLQITPNMHWAMSLTGAPEGSNLPEGKYICLEATVCAPLCATTYRYYDYAWNLLYSRRDPLVIDSEDDVQLF